MLKEVHSKKQQYETARLEKSEDESLDLDLHLPTTLLNGLDDLSEFYSFGDTHFQTQGILAPIKRLYGDGTYDRCALQSRRGYRDKKFSTLYVIWVKEKRWYKQLMGSSLQSTCPSNCFCSLAIY
uniref:Uncharacterized protein n=1 Tax=Ditylenchus dipsaci TaxID=166011 RepID=A0A915E5R7_9BILA